MLPRELMDHSSLILIIKGAKKSYLLQVTRAAVQTFVIIFSFMGKAVESTKSLEVTLETLLTKTADTNRYKLS